MNLVTRTLILAVSLQALAMCDTKKSNQVKSGPARAEAAASRVRPGLERDLEALGLHFGAAVFLRAFKEERALELFVSDEESGRFRLFRRYPIAAASGSLGPKCAEGDGQVPEGFYAVGKRSLKPDSAYHLAFNIGYPNEYDRAHQRTGSAIMVHGNEVSIGCLAMTDAKIEEIYTLCDAALDGGQPFFRIHLFPFRMTEERMKQASNSQWQAFWSNLKTGFDWFESNGTPPDSKVVNGAYHFADE